MTQKPAIQISILAVPDALISTLSGIYDVLNSVSLLNTYDDALPAAAPFDVKIVAPTNETLHLASNLPLTPHASIKDIPKADIIIAPSVVFGAGGWKTGRYNGLKDWIVAQHEQGATICSACTGAFLLAETGLFEGREMTVHWDYRDAFADTYPTILLHPEKALIIAGDRSELVTSGAANSWHDLVLYLITRTLGPSAAQSIAKFYALDWHHDGMAPFMKFETRLDHGDSIVASAQLWIDDNYSIANPVEEIVKRSGLSDRTFKRRFSAALGLAPIHYVQHIRIEKARAILETSTTSVEQIAWKVGYEDSSAFRRLFKRTVNLTPREYRQKFRAPDIAQANPQGVRQ